MGGSMTTTNPLAEGGTRQLAEAYRQMRIDAASQAWRDGHPLTQDEQLELLVHLVEVADQLTIAILGDS